MKSNIQTTDSDSSILSDLLSALEEGLTVTAMRRRYGDKFVSPGISVFRFLELKIAEGTVEHERNRLKLKPKPRSRAIAA